MTTQGARLFCSISRVDWGGGRAAMKNPLHILCVEQRRPEGGQEVLAFSAVVQGPMLPVWKHGCSRGHLKSIINSSSSCLGSVASEGPTFTHTYSEPPRVSLLVLNPVATHPTSLVTRYKDRRNEGRKSGTTLPGCRAEKPLP